MMSKCFSFLLALSLVFTTPLHAQSAALDEEWFVVMEKTYAFTSPIELKERIDALLDTDYQVIIGIMPIYEHTEYPAMLEFGEVIRYAQAKGCRILLHFPIVQKSDVNAMEIQTLLDHQYAMFEKMEIYPRGILMGSNEIGYEWIQDELSDTYPFFQLDDPVFEYYDETLNESFPMLQTNQLPYMSFSYEAKEIPENFDFKRGVAEKITVDLAKENQVLMGIVVVGIVVFSGMIVYARKRNRKDFLKEEDDQ